MAGTELGLVTFNYAEVRVVSKVSLNSNAIETEAGLKSVWSKAQR